MFYQYKCTVCNSKGKVYSMIDDCIKSAQRHANKHNHILEILFKGKYSKSVFPTKRKGFE